MDTTLLVLNFAGVFVFAISGALMAEDKDMDIFGFSVLALMPAVGGGTLRDIVLDVPIFWLVDPTYLYLSLAAAVLTFFAGRLVRRTELALRWFDAAGMALFSVLGAQKGLEITGSPVIALFMGVATAVAGGIMRDVIANEVPMVLHREIYATSAVAGAATYVVLTEYAVPGSLWFGMTIAFGLRAAGILFDLKLPGWLRSAR